METAQEEYIQLVKSLTGPDSSNKSEINSKETSGVFNVRVSTCQNNEQVLSENEKTIFDWARNGELDKIRSVVDTDRSLDLNTFDDNV